MTTLYLAFGSNLRIRSMKERCPDARPVGKLLLDNCRLVFRGVADLAYEKGHQAPVGLWIISEGDEDQLDIYEGVSSGFYGKYWVTIPDLGEKALVYLMHDNGIYPPSAWYANTIRDGYRNFGLELSFLDEAIRHAYTNTTPSEQTKSRRRRQQLMPYQRSLVMRPETT